MKLKQKVNNFYTKPRFFDGFTNCILTEPKALGILMVMGHSVASFLFGVLFICAWIFSWGVYAKIFLGLILVLTLWNLFKYIRMKQKTGEIFANLNLMDLLFNGGK